MFRVIRLAGPTAREAEEQVAKYIEEQVALYDRRDLGTRTRRDGNGGLRIDFTYDAAMPPVAMEITALVQPDRRALATELLKFEAELQEVVCSEDLGAWLVSVRVGTDVRRLRPPLVELLRRQRTRSGIVLSAPVKRRATLPRATAACSPNSSTWACSAPCASTRETRSPSLHRSATTPKPTTASAPNCVPRWLRT